MDPRIIALYDEYTHAPLDRRVFLRRLAALAGSAAAAMAVLPLLEPTPAHAALIAPDDARLDVAHVTYPGASGDVRAYLAHPKALSEGKRAAVVVIHENRGLTAHIEDVTRRLALDGFWAMAPDLLSPSGGTPEDTDLARTKIGELDPVVTVGNLVAALAHLKERPECNGKVGAVGFCWGGGMVGQLAVRSKQLDAGVVYYGRQPDAASVPEITAPLLLQYAELDERINAGIPAFQAALDAAKKDYTLHIYEGAQHAFNNDTSEARYNEKTAALAWSRTVEFLRKHLDS